MAEMNILIYRNGRDERHAKQWSIFRTYIVLWIYTYYGNPDIF